MTRIHRNRAAVLAGAIATALLAGGCASTTEVALRRPADRCGATPGTSSVGSIPADTPGTEALNENQKRIIATIVGRGVDRHISTHGQTIAVTTALDESTLRNLANPNVPESLSLPNDGVGHDHNSVGVFQQQPDQGWGTPAELMNPTIATDKFYDALLKVPGWESKSVPDAAAAVQHNLNGAPDYARYEAAGRKIMAGLNDSGVKVVPAAAVAAVPTLPPASCGHGPIQIPQFNPGGPAGPNIVAAAASQIGIEYAWGGGDLNGPTIGQRDGGVADNFGDYNKTGWDCSGLSRWAVYRATGKIIPRTSQVQSTGGQPVAEADARPGDLVFFGGEGVAHHVAIYIGGGQMIAAPQSGDRVKQQLVSDVAGSVTYRRYT
ncbi:C40 family peptidase [Nocardia wallacei]|uniref:C40 family peptidase n=1 Tax=Nocardia wallacei TaxID=480035 RepID=UPI002458AA2E|nr:C40 family peptidase [Nocardia wallacei]